MVAVLLVGCGSSGSEQSDNYGNLLASPGGLIVLEEEHPTGWMRADCFTCHQVNNMHVRNRTDLPNCKDVPEGTPCIDLNEIQSIIRNGGEASCMLCHGDNGVPGAAQ
jgi:hypothetical protein